MKSKTTVAVLQRLIAKTSEAHVRRRLQQMLVEASDAGPVLTIIANKGVHHLPKKFLRGEVFIASKGSLDFSSVASIKEQVSEILLRLARKLKAKPYKKVYLVPFGHCALSMQIKLLVYRVAHIETIDLFYVGGNEYFDYDQNLRELILNASAARSV